MLNHTNIPKTSALGNWRRKVGNPEGKVKDQSRGWQLGGILRGGRGKSNMWGEMKANGGREKKNTRPHRKKMSRHEEPTLSGGRGLANKPDDPSDNKIKEKAGINTKTMGGGPTISRNLLLWEDAQMKGRHKTRETTTRNLQGKRAVKTGGQFNGGHRRDSETE